MWIKRIFGGGGGEARPASLAVALERLWGRGPSAVCPHPRLPTLLQFAGAVAPGGDLWLTDGLTRHLRGERPAGVELGFVVPGDDPQAGLALVGALVGWILQCDADEPQGLVHLGHTLNLPAGEAELFRGFAALLFHYPTFLDPAALPLDLGGQRLLPMLCAPLTQAEWELKRAQGFEALAAQLELGPPGWEAWAPREASV